jgi:hypothetical protein
MQGSLNMASQLFLRLFVDKTGYACKRYNYDESFKKCNFKH